MWKRQIIPADSSDNCSDCSQGVSLRVLYVQSNYVYKSVFPLFNAQRTHEHNRHILLA